MASILTDRDTALARLQSMCAFDSAPALTADEVSDLLDQFQIATTWAAGTAYVAGARVVATTASGNPGLFEVGEGYSATGSVWGGTSGSTEPYWTVDPAWPRLSSRVVSDASDGSLVWRYAGPAPPCLWDLNAAAAEGWRRKAGKVAGKVNSNTGRTKKDLSDQHTHCLEMARRYAPVDFA